MYRTFSYLFAMLWGAVPVLVVWLCLTPWRRRRLAAADLRSGTVREVTLALFWMFCGGMAVITLLPRWVVSSFIDVANGHPWNVGGYPFFTQGSVNFQLFRTFRGDNWSVYNLLGNVIMFLPFGFFPALLWRKYTWWRALLTGFAVTAFIECCQLCVGRAFDVDDLLLNTVGAMLGYWLWLLLKKLAPNFTARFQVEPVP